MKPLGVLSGNDWREMFASATGWLEKIVPDINALNVYPVPDGDCGTNMLFTMRASVAEGANSVDGTISSVVQAMAKGALMGARGNSGVILSQIWRGLAESLKDKETIDGKELAEALCNASETAYRTLTHPVEGTILTVMKTAALAARTATASSTPVAVLEAALGAAKEAVAETPSLLPVLREAGVVDAGGHGLYTLLEGALLHLKGDTDHNSPQLVSSHLALVARPAEISTEEAYGFCTQFMIKAEGFDIGELREKLQHLGTSLMVVGDSSLVRVHIHALEPDKVIAEASAFGTLLNLDVCNMDEQHQDFLLVHTGKMANVSTAVVAVTNGEGLANVFSNLGVSAIVPGGQTMNPSTTDILQAVEAVPSDNVIILPNNKNIVLTASQVQSLTKKTVKVIPTETTPQGITALLAFSPEANFETNTERMTEAQTTVKTIEVTKAIRATRLNGLAIDNGQIIGLLDGELRAAGDDVDGVVFDLLSRIDTGKAGVVTIYYGCNAIEAEANQLAARINERYQGLEVGIVSGGQPHYRYIISVE